MPRLLHTRWLAILIAAGMAGAAQAQSAATSPAMRDAIGVLPPEEAVPPPAALPATNAAADEPGGETAAPPPALPAAAALPAGSGVLDSATVQRIVDRLVSLHFLGNPAEAEDPDRLAAAIRDFQTSAGISPTGLFDRDTVGRLTTP